MDVFQTCGCLLLSFGLNLYLNAMSAFAHHTGVSIKSLILIFLFDML